MSKKTYRIFFRTYSESYIDINAEGADEALEHFDMQTYDETDVKSVDNHINKEPTHVSEILFNASEERKAFNIFNEINKEQANYGR